MRMALRISVAIFVLAAIAGCGDKKVSKVGMQGLEQVATAALERAQHAELRRERLKKAKDPAHAAAVAKWADSHVNGLSADAKAFSDYFIAAKVNGLSSVSVKSIKASIETEQADLKAFDAMVPHLDLEADPPLTDYVPLHRKALANQIELLKSVSDVIESEQKKKEKEKKPESTPATPSEAETPK